jgi:hypothetical protein
MLAGVDLNEVAMASQSTERGGGGGDEKPKPTNKRVLCYFERRANRLVLCVHISLSVSRKWRTKPSNVSSFDEGPEQSMECTCKSMERGKREREKEGHINGRIQM